MIGNGGFGEVTIQDTNQPLFQIYLQTEEKTDITLVSAVDVDDEVIVVSSGHGFVASPDQLITIVEGDRFEQATVIGVDSDSITISIPSGGAFSTAATVIRGDKNLNKIAASESPIDAVFRFYDSLNASIPIDIGFVKITMAHPQGGDDSKFGGISALSGGGFYFRRINSTRINLGNYTNNQSFRDFGASVEYTDKGAGGANGTIISFDIKKIFGQMLRVKPSHNDIVCGVNRNDLSGLTNLYVSLIGSFTEGEA